MKVSVIIPAHNAEQTLERAISSALEQRPSPDEIVLASDGSTDRTLEIATSLGARVLDLPKSNGSVARNRAVDESVGDLLFFLDADDAWLPGKLAAHLSAHDRHHPSMVLDPALRVKASGAAGGVGGAGPEGPLTWEDLTDYHNWTSGSSFSVQRSAYLRVSGFNERLRKLQDVDFWVRCTQACGPAYRLAVPLTRYYQSERSITSRAVPHGEYLPEMLAGWTFAQPKHRRAIEKEVALNDARTSTVLPALKALARAGWPVSESLFWRALMFAIINSIRGEKRP